MSFHYPYVPYPYLDNYKLIRVGVSCLHLKVPARAVGFLLCFGGLDLAIALHGHDGVTNSNRTRRTEIARGFNEQSNDIGRLSARYKAWVGNMGGWGGEPSMCAMKVSTMDCRFAQILERCNIFSLKKARLGVVLLITVAHLLQVFEAIDEVR